MRELADATLLHENAFLVCFTSWGLVSPIARKLQDQLGLSNTRTAILLAVPVLCGSLLRLPFGVLADRFGGRRMFTITMLVSAVPAVAIGYASLRCSCSQLSCSWSSSRERRTPERSACALHG